MGGGGGTLDPLSTQQTRTEETGCFKIQGEIYKCKSQNPFMVLLYIYLALRSFTGDDDIYRGVCRRGHTPGRASRQDSPIIRHGKNGPENVIMTNNMIGVGIFFFLSPVFLSSQISQWKKRLSPLCMVQQRKWLIIKSVARLRMVFKKTIIERYRKKKENNTKWQL